MGEPSKNKKFSQFTRPLCQSERPLSNEEWDKIALATFHARQKKAQKLEQQEGVSGPGEATSGPRPEGAQSSSRRFRKLTRDMGVNISESLEGQVPEVVREVMRKNPCSTNDPKKLFQRGSEVTRATAVD